MITTKFRTLLEEYHRKQWFPEKHPDFHGEFFDYISGGMIQDLLEEWKKTKNPSLIFIGYYIFRLLPPNQFRDLFLENKRAYSETISEQKVSPAFLFYYLRTLPPESSRDLWQAAKEWCVKWKSEIEDWLATELRIDRSFHELHQAQEQVICLEFSKEIEHLDQALRISRDLFDWNLKKKTQETTIPGVLQYFRLKPFDDIADWSDFPALSKSISSTCGIKNSPRLRKSESENAIQLLFPIEPPQRLVLEYGKAAGVWEDVRFAFEFGKGAFYAGMNPSLSIEHRICGDPCLPLFWGYLFSNILARSTGLHSLVNPRAEGAAEDVHLFLQFWVRYDAALAIYHSRVEPELKESKDLYIACFENAFTLNPPDFLYLYDLARSNESLFRVIAYRGALAAEERMRSLYGSSWFASEKCSAKMREYWMHGFQTTMNGILEDLDASPDPDFLLTLKA